jgi:hypothetical protein
LIVSKQGEAPIGVDDELGGPAQEKPHYSRSSSPHGALRLMEQKLREALDRASFECPVARVENGVYSFGPNVCATVDLSPENEVIACLQGEEDWMPIDEFIRSIAQRPAHHANVTPPAAWSNSGPGGSKSSSVDSVGELQSEHRFVGPPAKTIPPYSGSPQTRSIPNGTGAVPSTSPRQVAQVQPSGLLSSRQASGSTPERVRAQVQQSPPPGVLSASQVLPSGTAHPPAGCLRHRNTIGRWILSSNLKGGSASRTRC